MKFRVVAISLFAAIFLASPAITSGEQARKGKGYSPKEGGGSSGTATRSGGDNRSSGGGDRTAGTNSQPAERRAESRPEERRAESRPEERRAESRSGNKDTSGNDDDRERYAVRRNNNAVVNSPRSVTRDDRSNTYRDRDYRGGRNDWTQFNINIGSSYGRHYAPVHYDYWARQYLLWSPARYAPWGLIYGSIGYPNYGYYGPYGGYSTYPTYAYPHEAGGIRLKIRPRDAQVFVDGYYAGLVDDFDGVFQALRLEAGGHKVEIRMPGFEDLALDVHVQPGRTLTLEEFLRPRP